MVSNNDVNKRVNNNIEAHVTCYTIISKDLKIHLMICSIKISIC